MLLVEHKSPEALAYFQLLSMTIYFFIGNLQETNLKYMNIQELRDFTDKSMNGFRLDGLQPKAGNIPTGNGTCEQQNKFILTPNEMINHYRTTLDNPDPKESLKGDFTAMLAHTTLITGDSDLLGEFETAREKMTKNYHREKSDQAMLMQDINDYDFIPLHALVERFNKVNLKSDVYRFPSIVIYNLKILYNIRSSNSWETLQQLHAKNLMSRPCYDSLKLLLATAQYIRLSAYLFHDAQNEAVTFLQKSETAQSMRGSSGLWHIPYPLMFQMCLHIIGVKEAINKKGIAEVLTTKANFITDDKDTKLAKLHYSLENHMDAIEILERQGTLSLQNKVLLATCYRYTHQMEKAKVMSDEYIGDMKKIASKRPNSKIELITKFFELQVENSTEIPVGTDNLLLMRKMLENKLKTDDDDQESDPTYSHIYLNQAKTYVDREEYDEAEILFDMSWRVWHNKQDHLEKDYMSFKADFYFAKGDMLFRMELYSKAKELTEKSMELYEEMFGSDCEVYNLGHCYHQIAKCLFQLKDYDKAIAYYELAIPSLDHQDYTTGLIYLNLGKVLYEVQRYADSEENLLRAQYVVSSKAPAEHYDLAQIKFLLGFALSEQVDRKAEALFYFTSAIFLFEASEKPDCYNLLSAVNEIVNASVSKGYTILEEQWLHQFQLERCSLSFLSLVNLRDLVTKSLVEVTLMVLSDLIRCMKKWCVKNMTIDRIINPDQPTPVYEFRADSGFTFFL